MAGFCWLGNECSCYTKDEEFSSFQLLIQELHVVENEEMVSYLEESRPTYFERKKNLLCY